MCRSDDDDGDEKMTDCTPCENAGVKTKTMINIQGTRTLFEVVQTKIDYEKIKKLTRNNLDGTSASLLINRVKINLDPLPKIPPSRVNVADYLLVGSPEDFARARAEMVAAYDSMTPEMLAYHHAIAEVTVVRLNLAPTDDERKRVEGKIPLP